MNNENQSKYSKIISKIDDELRLLFDKIEIPINSSNTSIYFPLEDSELFIEYLCIDDFKIDLEQMIKSKLNLKNIIRNKNSNIEEKLRNIKIRILDMGCGTGILGFCLAMRIFLFLFEDFRSMNILISNLANETTLFSINVDFVDINPKAIETTKSLIKMNRRTIQFFLDSLKKRIGSIFIESGLDLQDDTYKKIINNKVLNVKINPQYFVSDLFSNYGKSISYKYDLIVFNPPYLPSEKEIIKEDNKKDIDLAWDAGDNSGNKILKKFFTQVPSYIQKTAKIYFITSSNANLVELKDYLSKNNYKIELLHQKHIFFEDILLFSAQLYS
ncbi:MAG: hypothetical protein ACTSRZ_05280 [Promethearchaeota archaeon]